MDKGHRRPSRPASSASERNRDVRKPHIRQAEQAGIKSPDSSGEYRLLISCALGVERALGNELRHLGFSIADSGPGRFEIVTQTEGVYLALRGLRTAERVMALLGQGPAGDFDQLFETTRSVPWEDWLPRDAKVLVDKVRIRESRLTAVPSVQASIQKAVYERLGKAWGVNRLPESGDSREIRAYLEHDRIRLCLDLSGDALHKRGWRVKSGIAPIKETIAAAMVLLSGWKRRFPLIDPFCGSGTIAFEALLFAYDIPPNLNRRLGVETLPVYDAATDRALKEKLSEGIRIENPVEIYGSDHDSGAIASAAENMKALFKSLRLDPQLESMLAQSVKFDCLKMQDAARNIVDPAEHGYIITNPPYGERLGDLTMARDLYAGLSSFRDVLSKWKIVLISTYDRVDAEIGEVPSWTKAIRNGASDAILYLFDPEDDHPKGGYRPRSDRQQRRLAPRN